MPYILHIITLLQTKISHIDRVIKHEKTKKLCKN